MGLSEREVRYSSILGRIEPVSDSVRERNDIVRLLEQAGLPVFDPVLDFQQNYGGSICGFCGSSHRLGIFHSKRKLQTNTLLNHLQTLLYCRPQYHPSYKFVGDYFVQAFQIQEKWYFRINADPIEEIIFIGQDGEISVQSYEFHSSKFENETPRIISRSIETYLERQLILQERFNRDDVPGKYGWKPLRLDKDMFDVDLAIARWGLVLCEEASEEGNQIWRRKDMLIMDVRRTDVMIYWRHVSSEARQLLFEAIPILIATDEAIQQAETEGG